MITITEYRCDRYINPVASAIVINLGRTTGGCRIAHTWRIESGSVKRKYKRTCSNVDIRFYDNEPGEGFAAAAATVTGCLQCASFRPVIKNQLLRRRKKTACHNAVRVKKCVLAVHFVIFFCTTQHSGFTY